MEHFRYETLEYFGGKGVKSVVWEYLVKNYIQICHYIVAEEPQYWGTWQLIKKKKEKSRNEKEKKRKLCCQWHLQHYRIPFRLDLSFIMRLPTHIQWEICYPADTKVVTILQEYIIWLFQICQDLTLQFFKSLALFLYSVGSFHSLDWFSLWF